MAKDTKKVDDIMAESQTLSADDPDLVQKLNELAQQLAVAKGQRSENASTNVNVAADPMDELGCEGCQ